MFQNLLQKMLRHKAVVAIASILFGIYLIVAGRSVLDTVLRVAGWGLLVIAAIYLLGYFIDREHRDTVQLGYAVLCGLAGLTVIRFAPAIVNFFPRVAGVLLVITGASNLMGAVRNNLPLPSKVAPVLIILLGIMIFFQPGVIANTLVLLIGIALILNGLSDLDLVFRLR